MPYFIEIYCTNEAVLNRFRTYLQHACATSLASRLKSWQECHFGAIISYCETVREKSGGMRVDMETENTLPWSLLANISEEYPAERIEMFYAKEGSLGHDCGVMHFQAGQCSENLIHPNSKAAIELSQYLIGYSQNIA